MARALAVATTMAVCGGPAGCVARWPRRQRRCAPTNFGEHDLASDDCWRSHHMVARHLDEKAREFMSTT
jgi:hypothetical protein